MKIIHVPHNYYPDPVGGSEIYVDNLSRILIDYGVSSTIIAPADDNYTYEHNGIEVRRFKVSSGNDDCHNLYKLAKDLEHSGFEDCVLSIKPDIIHLHSSILSFANTVINTAARNRIPVIFTYHTPILTCMRGTLLKFGKNACDGRIDIDTCSACAINYNGIPVNIAELLISVSQFAGWLPAKMDLRGGIWTALRMTELVAKRKNILMEIIDRTDCIVALNQWTINLLKINDVDDNKIKMVRHGINFNINDYPINVDRNYRKGSILRLVYLGRIVKEKGLEILLKALATIPDVDLTLDIFGITQNSDLKFKNEIQYQASGDKRVRFKQPVKNNEVINVLAGYDILVVPSQWYETGPLVVLEAYAAGIPVIGSDLGGISEMVENGQNGILVRYDSIEDWAQKIKSLANNDKIYRRLKNNVSPPRTTDDVAKEMIDVYNEVLANKKLSY